MEKQVAYNWNGRDEVFHKQETKFTYLVVKVNIKCRFNLINLKILF